VPEVAINEHGNTPIPEYKIRTARQISGMVLEGKARVAEQTGYDPLGPRIAPLNLRHDGAALFGGHDVAPVTTQAVGVGMLPVCGQIFGLLSHKLPSAHSPTLIASLNLLLL
jgi:hypothetical protein